MEKENKTIPTAAKIFVAIAFIFLVIPLILIRVGRIFIIDIETLGSFYGYFLLVLFFIGILYFCFIRRKKQNE